MAYRSGGGYYRGFTTANPSTGAVADADSTPTAVANRNGTDDGAFALTVTRIDLGRYMVSGTIPAGYAPGDVVNVVVTATVSTQVGKAWIDRFVIEAPIPTALRTGTAVSGNAATIRLDAGASAVSGTYQGLLCVLTGGTGAGQARVIVGYNGSQQQCNLDRNWITAPDATTKFALVPADGPAVNANLAVTANVPSVAIASGTAAAGTANTITLAVGSSSANAAYVGNTISLTAGTGLGQSRTIVSYVGSTRVATVSPGWVTAPDISTGYVINANVTPSQFSAQGVIAAATSTTATLDTNASTTAGIYVGSFLTILSGTGAGQTGTITGYTTGRLATVTPAWAVTPDTTSAYAVIPTAQALAGTQPQPADPLLAPVPGGYTAGTAGYVLGLLDAAVSSRSTYAGTDTPGTTTLLARLTAGRATNLDNLDAAVSTRSTYAGADTAGTTSLLSLVTGLVVPGDHTQYTAHALALAPATTAGDPLASPVPGAYAAGTAGYVLGHPVDVATVADKAGYALAPTGLDAIPLTPPAGVAATFREAIIQTWRRFFSRVHKDAGGLTITTYADDGTTPLTTQAYRDDNAGTEDQGAATSGLRAAGRAEMRR